VQRLDDVTVLETLDDEECWRLIATQGIGRVAFVVDGEPAVLPVTFAAVPPLVIFRTAAGSAFDQLVRDAQVAFEVDCADPAYHSGWSVVGRGVARRLEGRLSMAELSALRLRPWGLQVAPSWIGVDLAEVTGRRIVQAPVLIGGGPSGGR
jgi:nitroimidazol reductase NimA-like FMN-containing flavoprotein (pyridoxamine 5'-phosphate oxidase superfamily)